MELLTAILFSFAIALLIVWIGFKPFFAGNDDKNQRKLFGKRNVKYVSNGNLFVDSVRKIRSELKRHDAIQAHGPVHGFVLMGSPTIVIADPELIELVLSKHFTNFVNRRSLPMIDPIFNDFIFSARGEKWKRVRATLTPTFANGKIRLLKTVLDETVQTLLKNANDLIHIENTVDVRDLFSAFTMNSIIQMAFAIKIDSIADKSNPFYVHATRFSQNDFSLIKIIKATMMYLFPSVANALNVRLFGNEFDFFAKISEDIIKKKREALQNDPKQKPINYIELILEAEEEFKKVKANNHESKAIKYMTNGEIIAQSIMFFVAGFDTVQTVLTHAMYELAIHQDVQQQLYNEINHIMSQNPEQSVFETFSFDVINKMEFLNAVLNETLRLHTPATNIERVAEEDITLKSSKYELYIKKDDVILVPIYSLHRDSENFSEPEVFDPNRFIGEKTFHKYSYIPFGGGPRDCVARSMAYFEAKMALLHFIRCFRVEICEKTPFPIEYYFQILGGGLINKQVHLKVLPRS